MPKKKLSAANEKTELQKLLKLSIDALKQKNYKTYIARLDDLGSFLNRIYQKQHPKHKSNKTKALKYHKIKWLEGYVHSDSDLYFDLPDHLSYCVFEEAWIDELLKTPIIVNGKQNYRRFLSPKADLNISTRHNINLGMRAVAASIKKEKKTPSFAAYKELVPYLDKQACKAIKTYRTKRQRVLQTSGTAIAIIMAIVCSILTAGAVAITVAAWPLAIAGAITLIVFAASLAINWFSFRKVIPRMLNDIFGKDRLFEGWTSYRDPKTGKKIHMSLPRKIALGISSALAATLSMVTGGVTYGFVIGLGKLALFTFLAAGTIGASCLPPLGIIIATIFCASSLVVMMKPILNIIRSRDFKSIFTRPFAHTAAIFDPTNKKNAGKSPTRLKVEKGITYGILGVLSAFTLFGLIVLQIQNSAALGNFLSQTLAISSAIAVGVAYTIGMASVLIGQLPYALNTLVDAFVAIVAGSRNIFSRSKKRETTVASTDKPSVAAAITHSVIDKTHTVIDGIKNAVKVISPNKSIKKDATTARLAMIFNLDIKKTTIPIRKMRTASRNYSFNKQLPRPRYYDLYLFAKKDIRQSAILRKLPSSTHRRSRPA